MFMPMKRRGRSIFWLINWKRVGDRCSRNHGPTDTDWPYPCRITPGSDLFEIAWSYMFLESSSAPCVVDAEKRESFRHLAETRGLDPLGGGNPGRRGPHVQGRDARQSQIASLNLAYLCGESECIYYSLRDIAQKQADRQRRHTARRPQGSVGGDLSEGVASTVPETDAAALPRDFAVIDCRAEIQTEARIAPLYI
jgi:hypothetical protein